MASDKLRKYLAYYQKVLREDPENIEARLRLAAIFREMGRKTHAVEEYVAASKLLARDGLPLEAIAACKAVLELDPTHTEIQFFLARLFAQVPEATGHAGRIARPVEAETESPSSRELVIPRDTRGFDDVSDSDLEESLIELNRPKAKAQNAELTKNEDVLKTVWSNHQNAQFEEDSLAEVTEVDEDQTQHDLDSIVRLRREEFVGTQDIEATDILSEAPSGIYVRERQDTLRMTTELSDDLIVSVEPTETIELGVFDMESLELDEESIEFELPELDEFEEPSSPISRELEPRVLNVRRSEIPEIPLLSQLTQEAFLDLLNVVEFREVPEGELLLSPSNEARALFIIVKGEVEVWKETEVGRVFLDTMKEGSFFGEFQLLTGRAGRANVSAKSDVRLLELSEPVLNRLGDRYPEVWDVLWEFFFRRMLNNLLASSPIFRSLSQAERQELAGQFRQEEYLSNDVVTKEGEFNDHLLLVLSGELVVQRDLGGIKQELARIAEGEFLGVASTLGEEAYPADVIAARDTVLHCLSGERFRALVDGNIHVAREVHKEMRKRRSLSSQFTSGITTYAELGVTREE